MKKYLLFLFFLVVGLPISAQPATEVITFTGTLYEDAILRTSSSEYKVTSFPFKLTLRQEEIPQTISITSPNYIYQPIYIRKYTKSEFREARQSGDDIRRVYLVKPEKKEVAQQPTVVYVQQPTVVAPTAVENNEGKREKLMSDVDELNPQSATHVASNTFAVIFANEKYQETGNVSYAMNDGEMFRTYCTQLLGIPEKNIRYRENATYNNMKSDMTWLKKVCDVYKGDCSVIVYYAGHGVPDEQSKEGALLPADGNPMDMTTAIPISQFYASLAAMSCQQTIVFLDACFSGTGRDGKMLSQARGVSIKAKAGKPSGNMVVISSATGDETAYPYNEKKHGLFTYFLLKKLKQTSGEATLQELYDYVSGEVKKQSIVVNGKSQTPTLSVSDAMREQWKSLQLDR